jgi:hypothetical protein
VGPRPSARAYGRAAEHVGRGALSERGASRTAAYGEADAAGGTGSTAFIAGSAGGAQPQSPNRIRGGALGRVS